MSLTDALTRVAQIQSMLADPPLVVGTPPAGAPADGAVSPEASGFSTALQNAQSPASSSIDTLIQQAAARYSVDPALVRAVVGQESGFDPNATSPAGAQGLMQLMPATARALGVENPLDPAQSLDGGVRYLAQQLHDFGGRVDLALAAYNAGPAAVRRAGGVPPYPETQQYVAKILAAYYNNT